MSLAIIADGISIDVYSFGILLFETLATPQYTRQQFRGKGRYITTTGWRPTPPAELQPHLWELICLCWEHDHLQRPDFAVVCKKLKGLRPSKNDSAQAMAAMAAESTSVSGPPLPNRGGESNPKQDSYGASSSDCSATLEPPLIWLPSNVHGSAAQIRRRGEVDHQQLKQRIMEQLRSPSAQTQLSSADLARTNDLLHEISRVLSTQAAPQSSTFNPNSGSLPGRRLSQGLATGNTASFEGGSDLDDVGHLSATSYSIQLNDA